MCISHLFLWMELFHLLRILCHLFLSHYLSFVELLTAFFLLCVVLLIFVSPHWTREFMICWFYQSTAFFFTCEEKKIALITFNYTFFPLCSIGALLRLWILFPASCMDLWLNCDDCVDCIYRMTNWCQLISNGINAINDEIAFELSIYL